MRLKPTSTLLFHLSDELKPSISPVSEKRPMFYWFNDSYHSHVLGDKPAYKYMYLFIVKPGDDVGLFTRHGKGDFASLWADYTNSLKECSSDSVRGIKHNPEPGIVLSFSKMTPVLIGQFADDYTLTIINRVIDPEVSFSLIESGQFRRFSEISELVRLCPDIITSVPIVNPQSNEIQHPEAFWAADNANEGRFWL